VSLWSRALGLSPDIEMSPFSLSKIVQVALPVSVLVFLGSLLYQDNSTESSRTGQEYMLNDGWSTDPDIFNPVCRSIVKDAHENWACFQISDDGKGYKSAECKKSAKPLANKHGGWTLSKEYAYFLDHGITEEYKRLFKGGDMTELGAGKGCYSAQIKASGAVTTAYAYDGANNIEDVTAGMVRYADLTTSPSYLQMANWVLSTEVGEHIPAGTTDKYISTIASTARVGVVLSWAVPGQKGNGHINCRSNEDIIERMSLRNFDIDEEETQRLRTAADAPHFKNTVMVFRKATDSLETRHLRLRK